MTDKLSTKTKFEKLLTIAEAKGVVTPAGCRNLVQMLDPFHDEPYGAIGFPDSTKGNSVVRVVPGTFQITVPPGGGQFDVHIFTFPELCRFEPAIANTTNHVADVVGPWLQANGDPMTIGLVNIVAVPSGTPSLPEAADFTAGTFTYPAGSFVITSNLSSVCTGLTRMISCGYKVCNTSPSLIAGGSAVHYRLPCPRKDGTWYPATTSAVTSAYPAGMYTMPPTNSDEAMSIADSQVTDAKLGNYMVCTFNKKPDPRYCRYEPLFVMRADEPNTANNTWCRAQYNTGVVPNAPYSLAFARTAPFSCVRDGGIDICGSYYTGLPAGSTLQLTTRVLLESFPALGNPDLLLASPSPSDDEVAWDLYEKIIKRIPNNALFHDNDTGNWWKLICAIGTVAAATIPSPMFSALVMPTLATVRAIQGNGIRRPVRR